MKEKVGNVILNLDYYAGADLYSDGGVEDELLEIVQNYPESEYSRIISERASWPILYHLSSIRKNCVEWIELDKKAAVLEIGAGCGAITGALALKVPNGKVTCVELSKRRSLINAARHKNHGNIEIIVGNFEDVEKSLPKFDVITLIGMLEYAKSYIHAKAPFEIFLNAILQHLNPNGQLIIVGFSLQGENHERIWYRQRSHILQLYKLRFACCNAQNCSRQLTRRESSRMQKLRSETPNARMVLGYTASLFFFPPELCHRKKAVESSGFGNQLY